MNAIELRGVTAEHAGTATLDGVDLACARGAVHAVIGPNGAGKTTLLRVAAGLLPARCGCVDVLGAPVASLAARERARRIAIVPQDLEAVPQATVRTFVAGGRYAHRGRFGGETPRDAAAVEAALARTQSTRFADRLLGELSGGERQRVLVARALAQEAPVLLCDEPTASLDVDQQIAVLEILAAQARAGHAVLLVTHDLNLASQFADRVTLLHGGHVVATGAVDHVLTADVLAPVYGEGLHFGALPGGAPLIVPRRMSGDAAGR